jgi:transposase-like protein
MDTSRERFSAQVTRKIQLCVNRARKLQFHNWVAEAERDQGLRAGSTTDERERMKALERENRELRQANEILRKASAYFAQTEFDRRFKPLSPS